MMPTLYRWNQGPLGSVWACGWWGGRDGDLLCIRPGICSDEEARTYLSPVGSHRAEAVLAFLLKNALALLDRNMRTARTWRGDRPSRGFRS